MVPPPMVPKRESSVTAIEKPSRPGACPEEQTTVMSAQVFSFCMALTRNCRIYFFI